jgi:hypothetical protein
LSFTIAGLAPAGLAALWAASKDRKAENLEGKRVLTGKVILSIFLPAPSGVRQAGPSDCFSLCSLRSLRLMKFQFRHADIPLLSVSSAFG